MFQRRGVVIAMVCIGCSDNGAVVHDAAPVADAPDPYQVVAEVPVTINRNLDVLFVIDDSPTMGDKQANLSANFPTFINVLAAAFPGGMPDIHIGVVSTDMGTKGSESGTPGPAIGQVGTGGCAGTGKSGNLQTNGAPVAGTFISDIEQTDGSRVRNYTGELPTVFGQMARLGAGGCGFEQPLAAMRAALDANPANAGFLRPDAVLGVVFLTDEDDCSVRNPTMFGPESPSLGPLQSFRCTRFGVTCTSGGATSDEMNQVGAKSGCTGSVGSTYMTDVAPYRDFLISLKGDARKVAVGAIMGTPTPFSVELRSPPGGGAQTLALTHSCTYTSVTGPESADPPARLAAFLSGFPQASAWTQICQQNFSTGLADIGALLSRKLGTSCVTASLADVDPAQPGTQSDCIVDDLVGSTVTPIPACGTSPQPTCWRLEEDAINCLGGAHLSLVVTRAEAPNPETVTRMRCLVQ